MYIYTSQCTILHFFLFFPLLHIFFSLFSALTNPQTNLFTLRNSLSYPHHTTYDTVPYAPLYVIVRYDTLLYIQLNVVYVEIYTRSMYILHYTMYSVHCALYTIYCTMFIVHTTLYTIQCTVGTVHCTLCIVQCSSYILHSTVYTVKCTHCALYNVYNVLI